MSFAIVTILQKIVTVTITVISLETAHDKKSAINGSL